MRILRGKAKEAVLVVIFISITYGAYLLFSLIIVPAASEWVYGLTRHTFLDMVAPNFVVSLVVSVVFGLSLGRISYSAPFIKGVLVSAGVVCFQVLSTPISLLGYWSYAFPFAVDKVLFIAMYVLFTCLGGVWRRKVK